MKQFAKCAVDLSDQVGPTDTRRNESRQSMTVDRSKYQTPIPLPPKTDPLVTTMQVEEKPMSYTAMWLVVRTDSETVGSG